jgi:demethylmenaquinone methyltransferase/2-methoxy-6-polyprenyl-1,4-benzoquinol methylase
MTFREQPQSASAPGAIESERRVREMFDRISRRYDTMNRLMTGFRDESWRRAAADAALGAGSSALLDVATGTGDLAFALAKQGGQRVIGLDFSKEMIEGACAKLERASSVSFLVGDALRLPFRDSSFDAVTVAFGLRNMANYEAAIREFARVIRPGGRFVCLELTPFRRPVLGPLFAWYFNRIVPFVGGLISGEREAYRYLPTSVASFPDATSLANLMRSGGFSRVEVRTFGAGTVALHIATKETMSPARGPETR